MIATITMKLERNTIHGFSEVQEVIRFRKDRMEEGIRKVNEYISKRMNDVTRIRVTKFSVNIKKNADAYKYEQRWEYTPTYR